MIFLPENNYSLGSEQGYIKPMKPRTLFMLMVQSTLLWAMGSAIAQPLESWPDQFIEFAKEVRQSDALSQSINSARRINEYRQFHPNSHFQNFAEIMRRLSGKNTFPEIQLLHVNNYCHVKFEPNFTCGAPSKRRSLEGGYLYVSDPITNGKKPFLLVILSSTAPKRTSIYRLFPTHMDIAYDLFNGPRCGLDEYHGLRATYGLTVNAMNQIIVTQAERLNWDILPHESYQLNITEDSCSLKLIESFTVDPN